MTKLVSRIPGVRSSLIGPLSLRVSSHVKVMVHDGGPWTTDRRPKVVWVRVIGCDGEVFRGQVLNRPIQLEKVKQGDFIKFIVPKSGEYPILVREQYLKERENWIITPCNKCGLSELFDPPSELIKIVFPSVSADESMEMVSFTAFCGACGGILVVEKIETPIGVNPSIFFFCLFLSDHARARAARPLRPALVGRLFDFTFSSELSCLLRPRS